MLKAILKSMRPLQWVKNGLLFTALVFDQKLFEITSLFHTLLGAFLFCLISSSIYYINDLVDIEADRLHPKKKFRPIPSGDISFNTAIIIAVTLATISLTGSFLLNINFGFIVLSYFLMQLLYSFFLKKQPIIDVMVIAAGFLIRIAAGAALITVDRFSPWLFVCTGLLSLYIGFGKRRAELVALNETAGDHRAVLKSYNLALVEQLITVVSASTLMAYSLYTFSAPNLADSHIMMLTIPFVAYGIFRYLYLMQVEDCGGTPEEMILEDRPLQITVFLWSIAVVVIYYFL